MSSKEEILSILEAFASTERMGSFFLDNATADFLFIRPSGNPLDAKGFENMWSSGDLVLESAEITKVHKFELLGSNAAICVFTLGSKFTYKGTQKDDLPTVTSIFKNIGEKMESSMEEKIFRPIRYGFMEQLIYISFLMVKYS